MPTKLEILIQAKNNSSGPLRAASADLAGLDRAAGTASKGLEGLALAGGVAGIVALGGAAVSAAMDMSRLAAQSADVEASFRGMAGGGADEMFAGLKESSRGAISDFDLMLSANRAMLLGVADSAEEMTALMDVARSASQAMGTSTTEAFSDLLRGIGTGQKDLIDNLGISVSLQSAYEDYARTLGITVTQLSDVEKKQALVNAVLRESAELVGANAAAGDDAASNFERMDASISNAKVSLGELFAPSMAIIATDIANAAAAASNSMKEAADEGKGDWLGLIALTEQAAAASQSAKLVNEDFEVMGITAESARASIAALGTTSSASLGQVGVSADAAKERLAALKAQADETQAAINGIRNSALGSLESAASSAVSVMGSSEVARIYAEQKKRLDAQIVTLDAVGYETDELRFKSEELARKAAEPFTLATEAAKAAEQGTRSYATSLSDVEQEAQRAFDSIRSAVEGVLSGALNHGTGVNPDDVLASLGLPREDAINESARRIADIAANGLKGQDWLGDFASDVPNIWQMIRLAQNPQEEAAYLLRDFQDGLLTSAIDKDKAKEIVRRQIMGDANMAEISRSIAAELSAEMGVPLAQALASAQGALGVGGMGGSAQGGLGAEAARSFNDGAMASLTEGGGATFVAGYADQMRSNFSLIKTSGADAAKVWGTEFLAVVGNNVPAGLVNMLVSLTTPGVISAIAQKGTMTGAVNP